MQHYACMVKSESNDSCFSFHAIY